MITDIEVKDDLDQIITVNVEYSVEESEPDVGYIGGVSVHGIRGAWLNVVAPWVEDGELIIDIDPDKLDLADLMETLENEIAKLM